MSKNQTPVVFTGDAGDYFGIWIVNLMLSIVTLGIYSAWAKVRRKKYFYNNTLIDGVGFDYHANPIAILKGRIIAVVLLVLYTVLSGLNPTVGALLALILFLAIPWIVVRGMMFNARNTSHRGLRFDFDGKSGAATLVFIGYPLLILLTLGLAMPFVAQRTNKFLFDHHKFGLSHFQMNALVKDFYMIYLKLLGSLIVIGIVITVAIKSLVGGLAPSPVSLNQTHYLQTATAPVQQGGFIKVAGTPVAQQEAVAEESDQLSPEQSAEVEAQLKKLTEQMGQAEVGSDEAATTTTVKKDPAVEAFEKYAALLGPMIYVMILGGLLLYMLVIFLVVAYMQSRITNLVLNNTSLEHVGFFSTQRMRGLVWIYLSNILLLMFTAGLATPWAQIRMARYRAEHLAITGETDWDKFIGEKKESSRAMGEEIADMFDIDISFG
ncbi:MAG: DUF898 domain-containing protein [Methylococcaceae bacterium]|nr:DUF898 domain-containing protein [Methylococcaceae bacterium]MDD1608147.1 DUF898 domain-containing protein [Methylococcaceae bacterium]MDD1609597.1 DUF898 domain-containing protein [Methylococcaceae bacterium]